ncbi:hypothetical protein PRZ48_004283 [Zasmidium cellare]|uniref:Uncharacterized protein n=1 Tax=Zasmidium cellare TaxID=395010 RepID=A0ABR0EQJ3_ZASCE|nr:hypothetical protein PRZ48_004283 [Zasmidium cellare]
MSVRKRASNDDAGTSRTQIGVMLVNADTPKRKMNAPTPKVKDALNMMDVDYNDDEDIVWRLPHFDTVPGGNGTGLQQSKLEIPVRGGGKAYLGIAKVNDSYAPTLSRKPEPSGQLPFTDFAPAEQLLGEEFWDDVKEELGLNEGEKLKHWKNWLVRVWCAYFPDEDIGPSKQVQVEQESDVASTTNIKKRPKRMSEEYERPKTVLETGKAQTKEIEMGRGPEYEDPADFWKDFNERMIHVDLENDEEYNKLMKGYCGFMQRSNAGETFKGPSRECLLECVKFLDVVPSTEESAVHIDQALPFLTWQLVQSSGADAESCRKFWGGKREWEKRREERRKILSGTAQGGEEVQPTIEGEAAGLGDETAAETSMATDEDELYGIELNDDALTVLRSMASRMDFSVLDRRY